MQHSRPRARRRPRILEFAHGWGRRDDTTANPKLSPPGRHRNAPAGVSLLLLVIVVVLTALGIVRVHASTRVLGLGAEITALTDEQAALLDKLRRLGAERAYLRHPDQIGEVARDRLGMLPMSPDVVQTIHLKEVSPMTPEEAP